MTAEPEATIGQSLHAGRWPLLIGSLLICLALSACKQSLYSHLTEQEANEIFVVLAQSGLSARKASDGERTWAIEVESTDLPAAVEALKRAGLPRERFASLGEMFKREGIVSTPTEERVRFLFGTSQELSNTLSTIDGVTAARVHIVLPDNDPMSNRNTPASASVFIKHHSGVDLQPMLASIKSLVLRSVEGLTYDTVYVSLFPAAPVPTERSITATEPLLGVQLPANMAGWLNPLILAALLALLGTLGWLAYYYREAMLRVREQSEQMRRSVFAGAERYDEPAEPVDEGAAYPDTRIVPGSAR